MGERLPQRAVGLSCHRQRLGCDVEPRPGLRRWRNPACSESSSVMASLRVAAAATSGFERVRAVAAVAGPPVGVVGGALRVVEVGVGGVIVVVVDAGLGLAGGHVGVPGRVGGRRVRVFPDPPLD